MPRFFIFLILPVLLCPLPACHLTGPEEKNFPAPEYNLGMEGQITYNFLAFQEARNKGDWDTALRLLQELLEIAPSPEIYSQIVALLDQNNQPLAALHMANEGAGLYPEEYSLHMLWADMLYRQGKTDTALRVLDEYSLFYGKIPSAERKKRLPELTVVRQFQLFLLLDTKRPREATERLAAIPSKERSPLILFYEVLILRQQKQYEQASAKLQTLLRTHPDFTDGWLTLAQDKERNGDYAAAAGYYRKALRHAPVTEIYLRLVRAMIKGKEEQAAVTLVLGDNTNAEVKLRAALLFMDEKLFLSAGRILNSLAEHHEVDDDVALYLGIIAYDSGKDIPDALLRLKNIAPDASNRARMLHLKTLLHIRVQEYDAALATAGMLRDEYPDEKNNWSFLAELANNRKRYAQAEQVSREGLEQWPDDVPLLYALAMSLSFQNRNPEAIQVLEDILLLDENSALALNALGYLLAEEKRDLNRALQLIRKALAQRPNDVNTLDSLAWVYYQMRNYPEAWRVIKKCAAAGIEDATIWEHYGDIALEMNDKRAAGHGYAKALELNAANGEDIRIKLERLQ